jgi:hypothetical protein
LAAGDHWLPREWSESGLAAFAEVGRDWRWFYVAQLWPWERRWELVSRARVLWATFGRSLGRGAVSAVRWLRERKGSGISARRLL